MINPVFAIKLSDSDFQILKETKSLIVFDVETNEEVGEFDYPDELIKTHQSSLNAELKKAAQKDGIALDKYKIRSFLVLGKSEDDVNELGFIEFEDAILAACVDLGVAEVNGFIDWNVYLLGILL